MGMTYVVIWLFKYLRPTPRSKRGYVRVDKAQICCGLDIGQEGLSSVYTGVVPVSSRVQIPTHHNITGISDANTTFDAACFYKHYSREIETCFLTSQD